MKSSLGIHNIALDHIRAFAAFLVFAWHFLHWGYYGDLMVNNDYTPSFIPLALLDEGHTGVALFMTLSGYLFAKILAGKKLKFAPFIWNRCMRLLPLLLFVILLNVPILLFKNESIPDYVMRIGKGTVLPTLPNGGWSITVEFHFYVMLPIVIWLSNKKSLFPILLVLVALTARVLLWHYRDRVQSVAYYTIVGRMDQFMLGMLLAKYSHFMKGRHVFAGLIMASFMVFYWWFDSHGGYAGFKSSPASTSLWIFLPTFEGLVFASLIAWYSSSFNFKDSGVSKILARFGNYSYSIYLLHFYFIPLFLTVIHKTCGGTHNFYLACLFSFVGYLCMIIPGYLSYRFIESPFLKARRSYVVSSKNSI